MAHVLGYDESPEGQPRDARIILTAAAWLRPTLCVWSPRMLAIAASAAFPMQAGKAPSGRGCVRGHEVMRLQVRCGAITIRVASQYLAVRCVTTAMETLCCIKGSAAQSQSCHSQMGGSIPHQRPCHCSLGLRTACDLASCKWILRCDACSPGNPGVGGSADCSVGDVGGARLSGRRPS